MGSALRAHRRTICGRDLKHAPRCDDGFCVGRLDVNGVTPLREAEETDAQRENAYWSADEVAAFSANPGVGRILDVRPGGVVKSAVEQCLKDAGYCIGRLSITRDPTNLSLAAATFDPDVIYVTVGQPLSACMQALEGLSGDPKTRNIPLVALIEDTTEGRVIEEAYTRSGCDFFRVGATQIELLARTHLLVRLSAANRDGRSVALHEAPMAEAANAPGGERLDLQDPATGVYTRTYFRHRLPIETSRAFRYQRDLSLVAVRCASAGKRDDVAVTVAKIMGEVSRSVDIIARMEPDLFLMLLPETGVEGTEKVHRRIGEELTTRNLEHAVGYATLGANNDKGDGPHTGAGLLQSAILAAE